MKRLTTEQGLIITGFTGTLCCDFGDFHKDVEKRAGRPVARHELIWAGNWVKQLYRADYMELLPHSFSRDLKLV